MPARARPPTPGRADGLAELDRLRRSEAGRRWLRSIDEIVDSCEARFQISVGEPLPGGFTSFVALARREDGGEVVLKVPFPDRESLLEGAALRSWRGDGAVLLLDEDPVTGALLLERCRPGTPLADLGQRRALEVIAGLLPRLWVPAGARFTSLADEADHWRHRLPVSYQLLRQPFDRALLDTALGLLDELPADSDEAILVNQDLHGANVIAAEREPWLVIDPKPLSGGRAFALAPVIRSGELGHSRQAVLERLDFLSSSLSIDRELARGWAIAQSIAWSIDEGFVSQQNVEVARWLCDDAPRKR